MNQYLEKIWNLSLKNQQAIDYIALCQNSLGRIFSKEHLENLSASARNKPKITCEYCKMNMIKSNYTRWHGSKCKEKEYV